MSSLASRQGTSASTWRRSSAMRTTRGGRSRSPSTSIHSLFLEAVPKLPGPSLCRSRSTLLILCSLTCTMSSHLDMLLSMLLRASSSPRPSRRYRSLRSFLSGKKALAQASLFGRAAWRRRRCNHPSTLQPLRAASAADCFHTLPSLLPLHPPNHPPLPPSRHRKMLSPRCRQAAAARKQAQASAAASPAASPARRRPRTLRSRASLSIMSVAFSGFFRL